MERALLYDKLQNLYALDVSANYVQFLTLPISFAHPLQCALPWV